MRLPIAGFCGFFLCLIASVSAFGSTADPIVIVFYEEGCSDCIEMDELLAGMMEEAPDTAIARYEINDPKSMKLLTALAMAYQKDVPANVPIVFVADDVVVGMGRAQEFSLRKGIGDCLSMGCESPISRLPISQLRADLPRLAMMLAVFLALAWLQLH
jgi:thiol-disulfide isomerase/thioredoxin